MLPRRNVLFIRRCNPMLQHSLCICCNFFVLVFSEFVFPGAGTQWYFTFFTNRITIIESTSWMLHGQPRFRSHHPLLLFLSSPGRTNFIFTIVYTSYFILSEKKGHLLFIMQSFRCLVYTPFRLFGYDWRFGWLIAITISTIIDLTSPLQRIRIKMITKILKNI